VCRHHLSPFFSSTTVLQNQPWRWHVPRSWDYLTATLEDSIIMFLMGSFLFIKQLYIQRQKMVFR
jgi:hypothetical protein